MDREYDVTIKLMFRGVAGESAESVAEWLRKEIGRLWYAEYSETPETLATSAELTKGE